MVDEFFYREHFSKLEKNQDFEEEKDEKEIIDVIQKIIQCAFDEGRRFQKQISTNSPTKDSVMVKADI